MFLRLYWSEKGLKKSVCRVLIPGSARDVREGPSPANLVDVLDPLVHVKHLLEAGKRMDWRQMVSY